MRTPSNGRTSGTWLNVSPPSILRRRGARERQAQADPTVLAPVLEEADVTDTRPTQDNNAGPDDDPQDHDSLQQHARRETSKAEGENPDQDRAPSTAPPISSPD